METYGNLPGRNSNAWYGRLVFISVSCFSTEYAATDRWPATRSRPRPGSTRQSQGGPRRSKREDQLSCWSSDTPACSQLYPGRRSLPCYPAPGAMGSHRSEPLAQRERGAVPQELESRQDPTLPRQLHRVPSQPTDVSLPRRAAPGPRLRRRPPGPRLRARRRAA